MRKTVHILLLANSLLTALTALAQPVVVKGRVYDITRQNPLDAVSVLTSSGTGTTTDSLGYFSVPVDYQDSIWFSYLNKPTPRYAVREINLLNFEISLHVAATELKEVRIVQPSYRLDSMQNRLDYAKAFNFRKPGIGSSVNLAPGGGVGLDLNEFISMFNFRRNRRMAAFRDQLLREEEERFIDHRFNRALIIRLTGLNGPELDSFVLHYRPDIYFIQVATDYELQEYIKSSFSHYQRYIRMRNRLQGR